MARPVSGRECLAKALEMLTKAKSVEELRQAQSLILPLEYGFSLAQVAAVRRWVKGRTGFRRTWVRARHYDAAKMMRTESAYTPSGRCP